jgi:hypothetical protein
VEAIDRDSPRRRHPLHQTEARRARAILPDLVAVLFGDAIALAPVFAKTILDGGPVVLGALRTAPSVGALIAGLLITRRRFLPWLA